MIIDEVFRQIDAGRAGENHGYSMGLSKLEGIIDGVTKETYTLILSNSGAGKSSFALYAYVYKPLMEHLDDDNYKVLFFALEMSEWSLYIKLLSIYIFETYGIQLSFKEILSKKREYVLSDEHYEIVKECKPWMEKISQKLEVYDKHVNANTVYAILKKRLEGIGRFIETDTKTIYIPNNPNLIYTVVIDHIGLIRPRSGNTLKQEIDDLSAYLVTLREKCRISPVVVQQANREQGNIERFKQGKSAFTINDAKDSGNTVQDCNIMIALYNPHRDGLKTYKNYDIKQLEGNFRSIMCLKNRFGDCDVEVGCNFFGGINYFYELPKPDEIYDYARYTNPNYLLESSDTIDEPNSIDNVNTVDTNSNFNYIL
jgi:hypothetical protein